ncbi:glycosyltransferase family 2 protein [Thermococcus thermotolerans]|uniref:glycosyltransferase family 2 protein n=1 Tax=Thermococcus thermotolerans TaxID=2969672 RepID=UPI0021576042|nr:glycosyltransferase family 2 protein [Thermococcus thermotolerans]
MKFKKTQISVIMCVKNREKEVERALKSVKKQKGVLEIIVVDGNSTDRTIEIARKYTDKIYSDEGKGLAYARQLGAEKAKGEYIAYIDSDTELPKEDLLIRMIKEMEKKGWVAIHAQLVNPRKNKTLWEYCENMHLTTRFNKPGERRYLGTIVCVVKRNIVLKYRFDPFMKYAAEDTEFWSRVGKEHKFGVSKEVAFHYHRASFKDFVKQRVWYGKGNARAIVKHKAWKLLLVPFGIIAYGVFQALECRKCIKCIPYYLVWGIALMYGTIVGLFEIWGER